MSSKMDSYFAEWLDIMLDTTKSEYRSDLEPFEVYKERMKSQGVQVFKDYVKSIEHGYQVIIDDIKAEKK